MNYACNQEGKRGLAHIIVLEKASHVILERLEIVYLWSPFIRIANANVR